MKFTPYTSTPLPIGVTESLIPALDENFQSLSSSIASIGEDVAYLNPGYKDEGGATYTLIASDAGKCIRFTAASPAVTIPTGVFRIGDVFSIRQAGTGTLGLTATGWTINGTVPAWAQHSERMFRVYNATTLDLIY